MRVPFSINAQLSDERPRAEAVNFFTVSRIGHDVQLLAGYMDLKLAADAVKEAEGQASLDMEGVEFTIPVDLTHRLVMGPNAFLNLKQKIDQIYKAMVESGHLPEESPVTNGENTA